MKYFSFFLFKSVFLNLLRSISLHTYVYVNLILSKLNIYKYLVLYSYLKLIPYIKKKKNDITVVF